MATLRAFNDYVGRIGNGYYNQAHFSVEVDASTSTTAFSGQLMALQKPPIIHKLPSLPSGVTGYRLTGGVLYASLASSYILAKLVNLGSLDVSTPTFTAGSSMPTVTEGGTSRQISTPIMAEVTTQLSASPGSLTLNYVDQDGNASEAITALAMTGNALVKSCGFVVLNGTDTGARSISSVSRTGGVTPTGVIKLWGIIPYAIVTVPLATNSTSFNLITASTPPPLLGADDELHLITLGATTTRRVTGVLNFVGEQA